jgi:hypothetical protein
MTRDKVRMRESNAAHGLQGKTIPSPFQTDAAPRCVASIASRKALTPASKGTRS